MPPTAKHRRVGPLRDTVYGVNEYAIASGDFESGSYRSQLADRAPELKARGFIVGGHAEGHKKQCAGFSQTTKRRCRKFAMKGLGWCKTHRLGVRNTASTRAVIARRIKALKYSGFMGRTLQERVDRLAEDLKPAESLRDELDLMRALAIDAMQLYSMSDAVTDPEKAAEMKLRAGDHVKDALNQIRDMAHAMVRIENMSREASDIAMIGNLANQFVQCVDRVLFDHDGESMDAQLLADEITKQIRQSVVLESTATTMTPDQDVMDMIGSVPKTPEKKEETNGHTDARSNGTRNRSIGVDA